MELSDAIDRIRPSVVQVNVLTVLSRRRFQLEGRPFTREVIGSGFAVNAGTVVTARHVVAAAREVLAKAEPEDRAMLQVGLEEPSAANFRGNFRVADADVLAEDASHDLAVIRLRRDDPLGLRSAVVLNPERPRDGEPIAASGYPLDNNVLVTNAGYIASAWSYELRSVRVGPRDMEIPELEDIYLADLHINGGNSGGPVYSLRDASVLGVCVASSGADVWLSGTGKPATIDGHRLLYDARLAFVVPASYVVNLLRENGSAFEVY